MMKKFFLLFAAILIVSNYSAYGQLDEGKQYNFTVKRAVVRLIPNFHVVEPNIFRSSQPSDESFKVLKEQCGLKTVLFLRRSKEKIKSEKKFLEGLGIRFISIPMDGGKEQSIETIEQCLKIISDKMNQPILIHCEAGKDRTGLVIAAYRIKYNGWSFDDALKEWILYGYDRVCCLDLEKSLRKWMDWSKGCSAGMIGVLDAN